MHPSGVPERSEASIDGWMGDGWVIGGDWNAHIGGERRNAEVCGRFGIRISNNSGEQLTEWCEGNGWSWVNSFFNHKRRGTWFSNIHRQWYELDGFLMRKDQRHRHARKMSTIWESAISDHKPKRLVLDIKRKGWRRDFQPKRIPQVRWEALRDEETARRYAEEVERKLREEEEEQQIRADSTDWSRLAGCMVDAAKETCGLKEKAIENEWIVRNEEEDKRLKDNITRALEEKNEAVEKERRGEIIQLEVERKKEVLKEARKEWKRERRRWEREWWEEIMIECERAAGRGDTGAVYKALEKLGKRGIKKVTSSTTITKEQFKDHFSKVSAERFENPPEEIDRAVDEANDLRTDPRTEEWRERLGRPPDREEVINEMKKMKDGAPGEDGARITYILKGGGKALDEMVELVRYMWENGADKWETSLKRGIIIPLFKKGNRNDPNNYRGVCLLPMGRRIVARIAATRLKKWAEAMGLLDDNQAGFRQGRSTADATQVMMRIQEDSVDLKKRGGAEGDGSVVPSARLLDLRKAYPRVNKTALWRLLKRYGLDGNFLRLLMDLHETTEYAVRGREGNSEAWVPERGLTEGCPSSPDLFNIYHQAVMRIATKERREKAEAEGQTAGIVYKWVPGSNFPAEKTWEKTCSEAVAIIIEKSLFADDTTVVGDKKELEEGVSTTKEVMSRFEERNNDDKEEELNFGEEGAEDIRMLGC